MRRLAIVAAIIGSIVLTQATNTSAQSTAASIYSGKCQVCHGVTGAGDTQTGKMLNVKSLIDPDVLNMTDSALGTAVSNGIKKMPPYKDNLTSDQITSLIQYLHQMQTNLQGQ